jgi:uncharacterized protein DUF1707
MTAAHEGDPANFRVSDAEREHVLALLQDALGRGMLSLDEFEERSGRALEARRRAELNSLLIDLPVRHSSADGDPARPAVRQDDVVELRGSFSSIKRKGQWQVPRKLVLRQKMGSIELDFTEARIDHPVVEIELDVSGGSVEMRLPEGASASTDGIEVSFGGVQDHRKHATSNGRPHFVITGAIRLGSVELRGPRRGLFW